MGKHDEPQPNPDPKDDAQGGGPVPADDPGKHGKK